MKTLCQNSLGVYFQAAEGSCGYSWGFRATGPQTRVGWSETAIFSNFGGRIFGTFRVEALKLILLCSVMKCLIGFLATAKHLTWNDLEMILC